MTSTAILIPTTAGLRRVCSARFREELPLSQIRLDGSFTPFPQSQAAHQLVSGPLRGLSAEGLSFDLALDGEIEDGRSWELGFATAWSFARFWPDHLTGDVDQAERVIWVTGAIDMDLAPQAAAYFLSTKLALSADLFDAIDAKGQELWVIAPPKLGSDDEAALAALSAKGQARVLRPSHVQDVLEALGPLNEPGIASPPPADHTTEPLPAASPEVPGSSSPLAPSHAKPAFGRPMIMALALGGLGLLAGVGLLLWSLAPSPQAPQLGLIAHHLSEGDKTCVDLIFGQTQVVPGQAQDLDLSAPLLLTSQGLCQLELINPGPVALALSLPTALSRLAVHDLYRNEAKIDMPAGARLTISLSAFPPKQQVVMMADSEAGTQGQFIIDFQ